MKVIDKMQKRRIGIILSAVMLFLLFTPLLQSSSASAQSTDALRGRVIILDPGHGIGSTNIIAGYDEQVAMLDLALRIRPLLEAQGATVLMTRATGENVRLPARAAMINIWALEAVRQVRVAEQMRTGIPSEDIARIDEHIVMLQRIINDPTTYGREYMNSPFAPTRSIHPQLREIFELQDEPIIANNFMMISLHSNSPANPQHTSINGAMSFHISNNHGNTPNYFSGFSHGEISRYFSNILLEHIETVGFRNLGPRRGNFFIIREHNVPSVLVENGFHTNPRDRAMLQNPMYLQRLAKAYLSAVLQYFSTLPSYGEPVFSELNQPDIIFRPSFEDVAYEAWYHDAVTFVANEGLLFGTSENRFSPETVMTRAMVVTLLGRFGNVNVSRYSQSDFIDVSPQRWYYSAAAWAQANGILDYIEGLYFKPNEQVSRQEAAKMLFNFFQWQGLKPDLNADHSFYYDDLEEPPYILDMPFYDEKLIEDWAKEAVYALRSLGIMHGDAQNRFNPQEGVTRAQMAQIFFNILGGEAEKY